jgi:TfoX/Sxy family transcriptional regulator of competence genes
MAYDEELARRIRELMTGEDKVSEMKMFGGLAFLVGGNIAIAASGRGGIIVRADPADSDKLAKMGAELMVMRGRAMPGWLRVGNDSVRTKSDLAKWVKVGTSCATSLPPK